MCQFAQLTVLTLVNLKSIIKFIHNQLMKIGIGYAIIDNMLYLCFWAQVQYTRREKVWQRLRKPRRRP